MSTAASKNEAVVAVDRHGRALQVGNTVRYIDGFGQASGEPVDVIAISLLASQVGEQFGAYKYRAVKLDGFGWVNPVARCAFHARGGAQL